MSVKDPRLSQILPVIRCSDCGQDVEFRMLGEHVCSSAPAMPALPVIPLSKPLENTRSESPSSGAYRPGHKPPPPPGASPSPGASPLPFAPSARSPGAAPFSPGRPSAPSSRPSLPFLEKYAKKNKTASSSTSSPPAPSSSAPNNATTTGSPISISPTTPTAPSYDRQVLANGMNSHYLREQNEYFPKAPFDDRNGQLHHQQPSANSRSATPLDDGRFPASSSPTAIPGRSKTPVDSPSSYSTSPNSMRASQPAVPIKSNARSPSIASAHGLGINGLDASGRVRSPTDGFGYPDRDGDSVRDPRDKARDYRQKHSEYSSSPPATASGFSRSGSSGSTASSILAERNLQRERSNTAMSERSERSVRSVRSEKAEELMNDLGDRRDRDRERERERERDRDRRDRDRDQHTASAYKTPSPPVSPGDLFAVDASASSKQQSAYRPPTPPDASSPAPTRGRRPSAAPARKPSGDQFDALMDDLIQEINVLPTSSRDSTRPASSHRSRSRPNIHESGSSRTRDLTGSPPPTPGLPRLGSETESIRSYRSGREGRERSERGDRDRDRDRERGDRGDRERDRDRERHREKSERADRTDRDRERERERDRDHRSERDRTDRERERAQRDRERDGDRSREGRDRDRSMPSARSSTRSRSTHRRGGVAHCEGCKHDIGSHEANEAIKMPHGDYHPECFKCARCRRPIESPRHGHEYEGRLLCEKDYQRYLEKEAQRSERPSRSRTGAGVSATCAGCNVTIQGETPVYALGQAWHEHHLTCSHCKKPINQSVGHVEKNGRIFCPRDFGELFLPKCRGCGLPVEKEAVCAQDGKLEGKWHAACFGCQICKKPFPDKSFYVFGDAPYCRRHYHKLNNSLCKGCDQPIEGPCAQTMEGWRFHPGCFCCVECKVPLTDIYYNFENQAYCEKDIMIIQRTRNIRAERRKTFFGKI